MIVMPANSAGIRTGWLAGTFPGLLGHLFSPGGERGPWPFMPYALDNGAFPAWSQRKPWDEKRWAVMLQWAKEAGQRPLWALVPDVVGDAAGTIASWSRFAPVVAELGCPLAFAAQDGMRFADVPRNADVVFLGGSTDWKREAIGPWCAHFPRVHVGRVNTYRWLRVCEAAGAESCDGTGWLRGRNEQFRGLLQWLREASGGCGREAQTSLSFDDTDGPTAAGSRSSSIAEPAACGGESGRSRPPTPTEVRPRCDPQASELATVPRIDPETTPIPTP